MIQQIKATRGWVEAQLRRASHYQLTFKRDVHGRRVLADLARECRAARSTYHEDAREQARLEGRRQVWLHISKMLKLTEADLNELIQEGKDYE